MEAVKHIHLTFVVLSVLGFLARGLWMIVESPLLKAKPVKRVCNLNCVTTR